MTMIKCDKTYGYGKHTIRTMAAAMISIHLYLAVLAVQAAP